MIETKGRILKVGTRPSSLALKQVEEIQKLMPGLSFEVVKIQTLGDKDKLTQISEVEGSDFFTREIDQALFSGEIDLAIHSSKDLPDKLTQGLVVFLETESRSAFDALVSRGDFKLLDLPTGYRIGSSSQRRKEQIKLLRPDLLIIDIRGTIEERLKLIETGKIDALIVAHAALIRLGLEERIAEILPEEYFKAHSKQGSLSVVIKEQRWEELKFILSEQALATGS